MTDTSDKAIEYLVAGCRSAPWTVKVDDAADLILALQAERATQSTDYVRGVEDAGLAIANLEIGYHDGISGDWHPYNGPHLISSGCKAIRALIATQSTPADPVREVPTLADISEWFDAVANPTPAQSPRHMAADYRDRLRALAGDAELQDKNKEGV